MKALATRELLHDLAIVVGIGEMVWLGAGFIAGTSPTLVFTPDGQMVPWDRWLMTGLRLRGTVAWSWLGPLAALGYLASYRMPGHWWRRIAAFVVVTLAAMSIDAAMQPGFVVRPLAGMPAIPTAFGTPRSSATTSRTNALMLCLTIAGLTLLVETGRRRAAATRAAASFEAQLTQARLDALRTQLHPHFLFNSLNTIAGLVDVDPAGAKESIVRLGSLLRETLRVSRPKVPLARELDWLEDYLDLQQRRFGDRLRVDIDSDPLLTDVLVPFLILQPLVENALRHGLAGGSRHAGRLQILVRQDGDRIELTVRDNGTGLWKPKMEGIGLTNVRQRLETLYAREAGLELVARTEGGTDSIVRLPVERAG